ncbi:hypothetical protein FKP32DRAFT_1396611 [Trametes sanguinea]|nr:hypothetical protein FKP32DRAFT_1396611 [Trametes sanguinea]
MGNLSGTDTESEASIDDWYGADLTQVSAVHISAAEGSVGTLDVPDALQILRGLDICVVKQDEQSHTTVQRVSDALLSTLDRIIATERTCDSDLPSIRAALHALLSESTLTLLLEYRAVFREIASRSLQASSTAVAVCWVDVILAKLGQSIITAAGLFYDVTRSDKGQPEALRTQKQEDMLRAAIQLPAKWPEIVEVLGSSHASPAAVRLASALAWGVYVMSEKLAENCSKIARPAGLFTSLRQRLKLEGCKRNQENRCGFTAEHERLADAMFVSLYAISELTSDLAASPYRPYSHSLLVEMIKTVLQCRLDYDGSASSLIVPGCPLDLPTVILLKWGMTVPWSWSAWSDSRLYGSDVILQMAVVWLFHLDTSIAGIPIAHSVEWWDGELVNVLNLVPSGSLSMMSRALQQVLSIAQGDKSNPCYKATNDIALKACWSLKYMLTSLEGDDTPMAPLFVTLYELFMLLGESTEELCIKDMVLEVLSLRLSTLKLAWATISHQTTYTLGWQRKLNSAYILVNGCMQVATVSMPILRNLRQTLQLLTFAYKSSQACPLPSLTSRLLTVLLDWLETVTTDSAIWSMLGDVTIGALTEWQHRVAAGSPSHRVFDRADAARVWRIIADADTCDLTFAASAAAHVISTVGKHAYDSLQHGECWDHLRDTMLMILDHDFRGVEEPLALLVAPTLFRALAALAQYAPARARRYFTSSPWTVAMVVRMRRLEDDFERSEIDEYRTILWSQGSLSIQNLIANQLIEDPSAGTRPEGLDHEKEDSAEPEGDFIFCWFQSRACLLPT